MPLFCFLPLRGAAATRQSIIAGMLYNLLKIASFHHTRNDNSAYIGFLGEMV